MLSLWWIKLTLKWQKTSGVRKAILVCLAVVFGTGLLYVFCASPVFAAVDPVKDAFVESTANGIRSGILRAISWVLSLFATWFMKLAIFFLRFLIEIGSYNGYIDSTAVNVGWVMVRDVTNMFFVVVLLIIAFGTILGIEQYEWKKLLVKFILMAVLVNFSRVICGLFIDVAQVIMITFLNGVAATAGGNLITAFKMDQLLSLNSNLKPAEIDDLQVLLANAAAVWFAAMAAAIIAGYALMMLARMVMLWILIVLSPLAFVLKILPQTAGQHDTWWKEFSNNVIVGPLLAFFLWLSFVTVGGGAVHDEIVSDVRNTNANNVIDEANLADQTGALSPGSQTSSGITNAMRFTEMAGFFIALGMLFAGVKLTLQFAPAGGSMLSKAADVGKKAGMIFSGAAAGVWAGRKAVEGVKGAAALAGKGARAGLGAIVPYKLSPEYWQTLAKRQVASFKSRLTDTGYRGTKEIKEKVQETLPSGEVVEKEVTRYEPIYEKEKNPVMRYLQGRAKVRAEEMKKMNKTEKQQKIREELLERSVEGKPTGWFQTASETETEALDRLEQGAVAKMKDRSENKTAYYVNKARVGIGAKPRFYAGEGYKGDKTVTELTQGFKFGAEEYAAREEAGGITARKAELASERGKEFAEAKAAAVVGRRGLTDAEEGQILAVQLGNITNEEDRVNAATKFFADKIGELQQGDPSALNGELKKQYDVLNKMLAALNDGSKAEAIIKGINGDAGEKAAFHQMYGNADLDTKFLAKQTAYAIEQAMEKTEKKNTSSVESKRNYLLDQARGHRNSIYEEQVRTSPALYQARAAAEMEMNNIFYQGESERIRDDASQKVVWNQYGIESPSQALKQMTVERLEKQMGDMNYEMSLDNMAGHLESVEGLNKEEAAAQGDPQKLKQIKAKKRQNSYISLALFQKLLKESWVDDGVLPVDRLKRLGEDLKKRAKPGGMVPNISVLTKSLEGTGTTQESVVLKIENERKKNNLGAGSRNLAAREITQLVDLLKGLGMSKEDYVSVKEGTSQAAIDRIRETLKRTNLKDNHQAKALGVNDVDKLIEALKSNNLSRAEVTTRF